MPNETSAPDAWTVYLASDDAAATAAAAAEHGGQVIQEAAPVADLGIFGGVIDPAGAYVGIWQSLSFPGFITRNEVGAPDWFETLSRDYGAAVDFYRDVFGWQTSVMSDSPEFRYTTLGEGREARAGIMDATGFLGDEPSRWQFYLRVADADASVGQAVATGAQVVTPVSDSPYGRMATLTDPAGVRFCVMAPNAG
jgi:predicted enzyme related to lactoylglutathione lyase